MLVHRIPASVLSRPMILKSPLRIGNVHFAWHYETALPLPSFWQNMICVVSELDQHTADFKGGSFPLCIVSSYDSCSKKKGESGAWRKVSTSPRKKSGLLSSPAWTKPVLSEKGKGAVMPPRGTWALKI